MAKIRVLATGVFDILHPGHIHFLRAAKELGDELFVVVANDETVKRMKGDSVLSSEVRAKLISELKPVDDAVIGRSGDMLDIVVEDLKPNIVALGYDQRLFRTSELEEKLKERGLEAKVVRLPKMEHDLDGSRKIVAKIVRMHRDQKQD